MKFSFQNTSFLPQNRLLAPEIVIRASILFLCMFSALLFQLPFYGDHVTLISQPAHFYYLNNFNQLYLPEDIATGHPPLYPIITAFSWIILGKQLWVSHALTLIFGLLLLGALIKYLKNQVNPAYHGLILILLLVNPVFLAQMANMSIDILLTALFFMGLNALHERRKVKIFIVVIALSLISLRGFIIIGILVIYDLYVNRYALKAAIFRICAYGAALIPVAAYFLGQYLYAGWWLVPVSGNWSSDRAFVSGIGFLGKTFEFGLRLVEFGMFIPVMLVGRHLLVKRKRNNNSHKPFILIISVLVLAVFLLPFTGPILVRYLLPIQILVCIYFVIIIAGFKSVLLARMSYAATVLLMLAQHFFVYPQMKSSVFDYSWGEGSLAHLSYFAFRAEAQNFLVQNEIANEDVFTEFPDYKSFEFTNLIDTNYAYRQLNPSAIDSVQYVIYCNNMNDISKSTETYLKQNFMRLKTWYRYPVEYILFENPEAKEKPIR